MKNKVKTNLVSVLQLSHAFQWTPWSKAYLLSKPSNNPSIKNLPGFLWVSVTSQQLTMQVKGIIIIEEPKCSQSKCLATAVRVIALFQSFIRWTTVIIKITWMQEVRMMRWEMNRWPYILPPLELHYLIKALLAYLWSKPCCAMLSLIRF